MHRCRPHPSLLAPNRIFKFRLSPSRAPSASKPPAAASDFSEQQEVVFGWSSNCIAVRQGDNVEVIDLLRRRLLSLPAQAHTKLPSDANEKEKDKEDEFADFPKYRSVSLAGRAFALHNQCANRAFFADLIATQPSFRDKLAGVPVPTLRALEFWSGLHVPLVYQEALLKGEGGRIEKLARDWLMGGTVTTMEAGSAVDSEFDEEWRFTQPPPTSYPISDGINSRGESFSFGAAFRYTNNSHATTALKEAELPFVAAALRLANVHPAIVGEVLRRRRVPSLVSGLGGGEGELDLVATLHAPEEGVEEETQEGLASAAEARRLVPLERLNSEEMSLACRADSAGKDRIGWHALLHRVLNQDQERRGKRAVMAELEDLKAMCEMVGNADAGEAEKRKHDDEGVKEKEYREEKLLEFYLTLPMLAEAGGWRDSIPAATISDMQACVERAVQARSSLALMAQVLIRRDADIGLLGTAEDRIRLCEQQLRVGETALWHILRALCCLEVDRKMPHMGTDAPQRRAIDSLTRAVELDHRLLGALVDLGQALSAGFAEELGFACFDVAMGMTKSESWPKPSQQQQHTGGGRLLAGKFDRGCKAV